MFSSSWGKKTKITLEGFFLFHFLGEYCFKKSSFTTKVPCGNIHAILTSWNRKCPQFRKHFQVHSLV